MKNAKVTVFTLCVMFFSLLNEGLSEEKIKITPRLVRTQVTNTNSGLPGPRRDFILVNSVRDAEAAESPQGIYVYASKHKTAREGWVMCLAGYISENVAADDWFRVREIILDGETLTVYLEVIRKVDPQQERGEGICYFIVDLYWKEMKNVKKLCFKVEHWKEEGETAAIKPMTQGKIEDFEYELPKDWATIR